MHLSKPYSIYSYLSSEAMVKVPATIIPNTSMYIKE